MVYLDSVGRKYPSPGGMAANAFISLSKIGGSRVANPAAPVHFRKSRLVMLIVTSFSIYFR
jgi:hypothetical protein